MTTTTEESDEARNPWPAGCVRPNSCARHNDCMYGCRWRHIVGLGDIIKAACQAARPIRTLPIDLVSKLELERDTAQAEATRLRAENETLRAALEPFANVAKHDVGEGESDMDRYTPMKHNHAPHISVGDLRRARAALASTSGEAK